MARIGRRLRLLPELARNPTEAWLRIGGWRDRKGCVDADVWDTRRELIRRLAPGHSFLDLGGMFGVAGEVAFWAEEAGAAPVRVFDGMDPTPDFARKHSERASEVSFQQGDLHDAVDCAAAGVWDVVWCAGVIYHSPNPFDLLRHLHSLTREWLLLGSHIVPEVPGMENFCLFYPSRSAAAEATFARHLGPDPAAFPGATAPLDTRPAMGYANMWWGLTPSALRALVRTAGFEIREEHRYSPFLIDVLAVRSADPDFIPPPGFSRDRGRATLEAMAPDERPDWWVLPEIR